VLIVETAAFALTALALTGGPSFPESIAVVGILAVLAAAHTEIARGIERLRWRLREELHVDLSSTWIFASVVLLSPGYAALTAIVVDAYATLRSSGRSRPLYRHVFSTATLVLAALAASAAMRYAAEVSGTVTGPPLGVLPIALGLLVFLAVNTSLVAGAIAISNPQAALASAVGEWDENVLEIASYCLGALAAAALVVDPWLIVLVFPPLLVLHRAVLVSQLEEKASTDGKTGLLNAAAWHNRAERELRRAERRAGPRAVLVVDLDHFKDVNDRHGHLAGDEVLAAVADALRGEVRERDLVGRFGGEEFVVLLGPLGPEEEGATELAAVAERIRCRIAALRVQMPTPDGPLTVGGLSASVGAALYPEHGRDVRSLLHVADTALYAAKRAGRNLVRMGTPAPAALPQVPTQAEPTASH
jgi:diguanylate cyclase (GGDEF)-like protein